MYRTFFSFRIDYPANLTRQDWKYNVFVSRRGVRPRRVREVGLFLFNLHLIWSDADISDISRVFQYSRYLYIFYLWDILANILCLGFLQPQGLWATLPFPTSACIVILEWICTQLMGLPWLNTITKRLRHCCTHNCQARRNRWLIECNVLPLPRSTPLSTGQDSLLLFGVIEQSESLFLLSFPVSQALREMAAQQPPWWLHPPKSNRQKRGLEGTIQLTCARYGPSILEYKVPLSYAWCYL